MTVYLIGCGLCGDIHACVCGGKETKCEECDFENVCESRNERPDILQRCDLCKELEELLTKPKYGVFPKEEK